MKVLVCGSRDFRDHLAVIRRLDQFERGTHIIHGGCRGADQIAGTIANKLGMAVTEFPADWKNLGRSAGFRRNLAMLDEKPDLVVAFWKDGSTGTAHTVREAQKRGIPVEVIDG